MAQNNTQTVDTAATESTKRNVTFVMDASLAERLREKCAQMRMTQSGFLECCTEALLGGRINITNGQITVN